MKKVMMMALIGMMAASQGFAADAGWRSNAPTRDSSWDEIYQAGLWPKFEKISFGSTFIPVVSVCIDGDNFKAVDPFKTCKAYGSHGDDYGCTEWEAGTVTTPRTYTYTVCKEYVGDGDCRAWETGTASYPVSFDVEVVSNYGGETAEHLEFTKPFTIPACK